MRTMETIINIKCNICAKEVCNIKQLPSGWKTISVKMKNTISNLNKHFDFCDECLASSNPDVKSQIIALMMD